MRQPQQNEPQIPAPWPDAPRFGPGLPWPAYRFVPGRFPHPIRDPRGHSHGEPEGPARHVPPDLWREDAAYLRGIDLYHAGYLWEAHEAWEGIWKAAREPAHKSLLRGLIQMTAALLKVFMEEWPGARKLAGRARRHLRAAARIRSRLLGLDLEALVRDFDRSFGRLESPGGGPGGLRLEDAPRLRPGEGPAGPA